MIHQAKTKVLGRFANVGLPRVPFLYATLLNLTSTCGKEILIIGLLNRINYRL